MTGDLKILIVDEDQEYCARLSDRLRREGFIVAVVNSTTEAISSCDLPSFSLFILEVAMTKVSGFDFAKRLKNNAATEYVPIIFCSTIGDEQACVMGLNIGADDYIVKPYREDEFVARVRSVLRRSIMHRKRTHDISEGAYIPDIVFRELRVDVNNKLCYLHGLPMKLTPTEYALLHLLVSHRNRIFSRSEIVARVWGNSYSVTPRAVDTTLARLRHKLGDYSSYIYTHKTCGYGIFDPDRTPA